MTCIVAYKFNNEIYMGSESASICNNYFKMVIAERKVFIKNNMIFGYSGSFRLGQLLQYKLSLPSIGKKNIDTYMHTNFIDSLRKCFEQNDFDITNDDNDFEFIVGIDNKIYNVHSDLHIIQYDGMCSACGCAEDVALGSMYILNKLDPNCKKYSPKTKILMALEATNQYSAGVCEPFYILKL